MAESEDLSDVSIDSDLDWELEQGIPQLEDPFIQKYIHGREALIEQEKKKRHGEFCALLSFNLHTLSPSGPLLMYTSFRYQTHYSNRPSPLSPLVRPKPFLAFAQRN